MQRRQSKNVRLRLFDLIPADHKKLNAVAGGGLTVIANAPNPAGQAILKKYFKEGVSPTLLLAGALVPTTIVLACFLVFR